MASNAGRAALLVPTPTDATEAAAETAPAVDPTALALARAHGDADPAADGDADTATYTVAKDTFLGIAGRLGVTADAFARGQPVVGRGRACCGRARC
ncbi:MAG: hypothetical protein R3A10_15945 [Caldilineaceae bacterium]